MTTLLMLFVLVWFCRKALFWSAVRLIIFAAGFRIGWKLLDRA